MAETETKVKSPKSSSDMLHWQYKTLLGEVQQIELHETGECPCVLNDLEPQEKCLGKHLLNVATLAAETASMDGANAKWLLKLAEEATERHEQFIGFICHKRDLPELTEWCRGWRKNHIEPTYYACPVKKAPAPAPVITMQASPAATIIPDGTVITIKQDPPAPAPGTVIKIAGGCEAEGTCKLKVSAIDKTEGTTASLSGLPRLVAQVMESHRHTALTPQTFALGPSGSKYEFKYKVVDATKLVISHDPFTFGLNSNYPQELQPRLRGRESNKQQVGNIAKNLDPEALLSEFASLDRGAPIIGTGGVVESGNGRVMAVLVAAKDNPDVYKKYKARLLERIEELGVKAGKLNFMKVPMLVRERVTKVDRLKFVEEANAATTIERSALELARTDASKITPDMLSGLQVSESESLDQAIREPKNKALVGRFLQKLPANEQARLVDAHGVLSQDGVRRIIMAIFVSAFAGDAGLQLAERNFESTDVNVKSIFNGIAAALSNLAKMEAACRTGTRPAEYSLADDLARAITVYSMIRRTDGMDVSKYMSQHQLFERELTPFQEIVLKALGEHGKSGRRVSNILNSYAEAILAQPPTAQASMIGGERPSKAQVFEQAVNHAGDTQPTAQATLLPAPAPIITVVPEPKITLVLPAPPPVAPLSPVQVCDALAEARETHVHFLYQPPDAKTGSHDWHRRWINVYDNALQTCPCKINGEEIIIMDATKKLSMCTGGVPAPAPLRGPNALATSATPKSWIMAPDVVESILQRVAFYTWNNIGSQDWASNIYDISGFLAVGLGIEEDACRKHLKELVLYIEKSDSPAPAPGHHHLTPGETEVTMTFAVGFWEFLIKILNQAHTFMAQELKSRQDDNANTELGTNADLVEWASKMISGRLARGGKPPAPAPWNDPPMGTATWNCYEDGCSVELGGRIGGNYWREMVGVRWNRQRFMDPTNTKFTAAINWGSVGEVSIADAVSMKGLIDLAVELTKRPIYRWTITGEHEGKAFTDTVLAPSQAVVQERYHAVKATIKQGEQIEVSTETPPAPAPLQNGDRVQIKSGEGGMKEFYGKTGTIGSREGDYYRVYLDEPVDVPGVGLVKDDLWMRYLLKKVTAAPAPNPGRHNILEILKNLRADEQEAVSKYGDAILAVNRLEKGDFLGQELVKLQSDEVGHSAILDGLAHTYLFGNPPAPSAKQIIIPGYDPDGPKHYPGDLKPGYYTPEQWAELYKKHKGNRAAILFLRDMDNSSEPDPYAAHLSTEDIGDLHGVSKHTMSRLPMCKSGSTKAICQASLKKAPAPPAKYEDIRSESDDFKTGRYESINEQIIKLHKTPAVKEHSSGFPAITLDIDGIHIVTDTLSWEKWWEKRRPDYWLATHAQKGEGK